MYFRLCNSFLYPVVPIYHDATMASNHDPNNAMMAQSLRRLVGVEYTNK